MLAEVVVFVHIVYTRLLEQSVAYATVAYTCLRKSVLSSQGMWSNGKILAFTLVVSKLAGRLDTRGRVGARVYTNTCRKKGLSGRTSLKVKGA